MLTENPVLVERYREYVLESFHRGVICAVDRDNKVIFSAGNVEQVCYPRSALKLFQVIPLLECGAADEFGFTTKEIAIMCGSHNGEKEHIEVVNGILAKIGYNKKHLKCGPQYPTLQEDKNELIKRDTEPEDIHNNCSGKHAGFLALCKYFGFDTEDYLLPTHPIHQMIRIIIAEMHNYPEDKMVTAKDGCSAPIFSLPVYNQAVGYKNLCNPEQFNSKRQEACRRIIEAMTSYPHMIGGTKRYCSEMMEICGERVFGKTGADGIYSLGFIKEGIGLTIKIDDGLMGPQYAVAQKLLEDSGIFTKEELAPLHHYAEQAILNWNRWETGWMKVRPEALEGFSVQELVKA